VSVERARTRFLAAWREVRDLELAANVLGWDQETMMPPRGAAARGRLLATLAGTRHTLLIGGALRDALADFEAAAAPDSVDADQARVARREVERAVRVPAALAAAIAERESAALVAWQGARAASDFAAFAPELTRLLALKRQEAAAIAGPDGDPYDAMLDRFEPGATAAQLAPLFDALHAELAPRIAAVAASGATADDAPARGNFAPDAQRALGEHVAAAIGFDFAAGRLDRAAHPFCSGFSPTDVRLTWRWQTDDFRPALFGVMHEAGHGLYEQGLPAAWEATPLGNSAGLGTHESQSRLWENAVGRSRGFWRWLLPQWSRFFPESSPPALERLLPALHGCRPSLIRVEADGATYDLHVIARFRMERRLFAGTLAVHDLPEAWNAEYRDLLGLQPPRDAEGVLQDIHWAMGLHGYFPTYTLGNLMAAQLFEAACRDLGDPEEAFAAGEFRPLLDWLRRRVHHHGSRLSADGILRAATGRGLDPAPYVRALGNSSNIFRDSW
jgi:carboxypeptidase Taq